MICRRSQRRRTSPRLPPSATGACGVPPVRERAQTVRIRALRARVRTIFSVDATEDLSHQLWTMRELLEQLVFKLEVQGLLLSTNRARWMPYINVEIEAIIEAIADVDRLRAQASVKVAAARGLPATISLSQLVEHLGPPWASLLSQHRLHLLSLQAEIEELSRSNHELARRGMHRTREVLAALGETGVDVYDPHWLASPLSPAPALRLDRTV